MIVELLVFADVLGAFSMSVGNRVVDVSITVMSVTTVCLSPLSEGP